MINLIKLRVHICPIGYEVDRIVKAAKELRAERVWLIKEKNPHKEKAKKFIKEVESSLKEGKIEVRIKGVARDDLFDNLKIIKEIIIEESENEIQVNVSAGSKIQAIAGMMACMLFKEHSPKPYYVEPKKYETPSDIPQSSGVNRIIPLPDYEIKKPEEKLVKALKIIEESGKKITKKKMTELIIKEEVIEVSNKDKKVDQSDYAKLDHNIIKPLRDIWKFIETKKVGRNHIISINPKGSNILKFLVEDKK